MNAKMKSPTIVAMIPLVIATVAATATEGQLECSVERRPLREVREQFKRSRNEVPTKHFHACKLKAYDNQA